MRWTLPLVLLLSGAAPERARFLFELRGTPVGSVVLSWDHAGGRFTYRSTHLFSRGRDRARVARAAVSPVDAEGRLPGGAWPSALWLWRGPKSGCVQGREELTGREGRLCAQPADGEGAVRGTMFGEPFAAWFSEGRLARLEVKDARFVAVPEGTQAAWPPDVFAEGVPVPTGIGALALVPPPPAIRASPRAGWSEREARVLARKVHDDIPDKRPSAADLSTEADDSSGSCLAHARRFVRLARARGLDAAVIHGLLAEPGATRAWPHVWVRVVLEDGRPLDLDPTSLDTVTPAMYLPLASEGPGEAPGELWLEVLSGRRAVVRAAR